MGRREGGESVSSASRKAYKSSSSSSSPTVSSSSSSFPSSRPARARFCPFLSSVDPISPPPEACGPHPCILCNHGGWGYRQASKLKTTKCLCLGRWGGVWEREREGGRAKMSGVQDEKRNVNTLGTETRLLMLEWG